MAIPAKDRMIQLLKEDIDIIGDLILREKHLLVSEQWILKILDREEAMVCPGKGSAHFCPFKKNRA